MDKLLKTGDIEFFPSGVFKTILNEVKKSCLDSDIAVDEQLVSVIIKLLSLDPSYGLHSDGKMDRRSLGSFARKCIDILIDKSSGLYLTLSMQMYFANHSINVERISETHRQTLRESTAALTKEIITGEYKINYEQERLLKKIAVDILVAMSMGNPINGKLVQETLSALKSVLSKNEIASFIAAKEVDRMESLEGIREVVCGILIFNRDNGFYVEDKIDVEQTLHSGFTTTRSQLNISLNELRSRLDLLSTVLANCINVTDDAIQFDNSMDPAIFSKLVKILILFRQHDIYVTSLTKSLVDAKTVIDASLKTFQDQLRRIHELVKFRTAIPTDKIFPEFTALAQHWLRLQDLILLLSEINLVNEELMKFADTVQSWEDTAYLLLGDSQIESDSERTKQFQNFKIDFFSADVSVLKYSSEMKIENNGLCTWCLVSGKGLLLPATLTIGVCKYKKKFYGFINKWAANEFKNNPEKFLFSIIEISRTNPELIHFLDKLDDLQSHRNELHYVGSRACASVTTSQDVETQTETHPIPVHVDRNYHWNIWNIRRKAIQLTNLMNSQTHSSQTVLSYGNYNANTQTYSSKAGETQTRRNRSTDTMPKPTKMLSYIRDIDFGGMSDEMLSLNLVKDLDVGSALKFYEAEMSSTVNDETSTFE
ncbi:cilia- and flagella-associated protein 206 [Bradysia coprophila]|uniref:cilia- and flagella-associated protein 206 n=1 Tax=Bradysia coprophila TaxID=38358 RepID=UPI00187D8E11|nr:cilia- and flagella-associated protein 206 [Bradysia coprophila]